MVISRYPSVSVKGTGNEDRTGRCVESVVFDSTSVSSVFSSTPTQGSCGLPSGLRCLWVWFEWNRPLHTHTLPPPLLKLEQSLPAEFQERTLFFYSFMFIGDVLLPSHLQVSGAVWMAHSVKYLPCKQEYLGSVLRTNVKKQSSMSTLVIPMLRRQIQVDSWGSLVSNPPYHTRKVPGQ